MNEQGQVKKGWTNGYFTVPNGIYEMGITGYAKAAYVYLCRRADSEGQSFPGYGTMAADVGFSKRTMQRAVDELIRAGLLIKEFRGRKENGEYHPNLYTVIHPMDAVPQDGGGVWSDRPYPPEGMVPQTIPMDSQTIPMVREAIPMVREAIPMVREATEGILIKDNSLTKPIKDTHTQEIWGGVEEVAATRETTSKRQDTYEPTERVCEEVKSSLLERGIRVQTKTIQAWLQIAELTDILYAAELATRDGVRSPAGFIGSVLRNGVVRVEEKKEQRDPRYEAFYRLMDQSK